MTPARIVVAGDVMTDVVASLSGPVAHGSDTPARVVQRGGGAGANVALVRRNAALAARIARAAA